MHLLRASSDEFGAYDGVNFSPKSVTPRNLGTSGPQADFVECFERREQVRIIGLCVFVATYRNHLSFLEVATKKQTYKKNIYHIYMWNISVFFAPIAGFRGVTDLGVKFQ